MQTSLDFRDNGENIFLKLATISNGLVKEGLSRESEKIAKVYKREIKSIESSEWSSYKHLKKGKSSKETKRLSVLRKKQKFGSKHNAKTGEPISGSIADHVKFYTPSDIDKLYAVIGGGHPTFRPIEYKNGVAVGFLEKQSATTKETLSILDGLNDGKTIVITDKMRNFLNTTEGLRNGGIKKSTKKLIVKPRHFAEKARTKGASLAIPGIKRLYEKNFPNAVANIKVVEKRYKTS